MELSEQDFGTLGISQVSSPSSRCPRAGRGGGLRVRHLQVQARLLVGEMKSLAGGMAIEVELPDAALSAAASVLLARFLLLLLLLLQLCSQPSLLQAGGRGGRGACWGCAVSRSVLSQWRPSHLRSRPYPATISSYAPQYGPKAYAARIVCYASLHWSHAPLGSYGSTHAGALSLTSTGARLGVD
eukprot:2750828-Rhodomonas_salina.2